MPNIFDTPTASTVPSKSSGNIFDAPVVATKTPVATSAPAPKATPPAVQNAVEGFFSKVGGVLKTVGGDVVKGVEGAYNDVKTAAGTPVAQVDPKLNPNSNNIFDTPSKAPSVNSAVDSLGNIFSDNTPLGIAKNTVTGLPKAALDETGVGGVLDYLKTPEGEQAAANLSASDWGKGLIEGGKNVVKGFIATPIVDVLGIFSGPKTYNVPGLGPVKNIQQTVKEDVQSGTNPYLSVFKAVPQSIFDGLMVAGVAEKAFAPREQVIATGVKTNDLPSSSEGPAAKNFRQTQPVSTSHAIPNEALDALQEQGVNLKGYDPSNPSFFRTTPMANGVIKGEIVQVKPSYFDVFKSKFGGDISKTPSSYTTTIYEKESTPAQLQESLDKSSQPQVIKPDDIQAVAENVRGSVSQNIEGLNQSQQTDLTPAEVKPFADQAASKYWDSKIQPSIDSGKAVVIGSDDLKDHFGKDYNDKNHPVYSQAANKIFERAVDTSTSDTVKFTVGGTGSGKSDFLVPDASKGFNGVVYDSTGFKYEGGLKKQIEYAKSKGKKVEIYAVIPDVERARAYTFAREARGEHPVSEASFVRTHIGAIKTMISAIHDGEDVYILDTRGAFTKEDIQKSEFKHNPIDLLEKLEYNDEYVKKAIENVSPETFKEVIDRRPEGTRDLSEENRPDSRQERKEEVNARKTLKERAVQLERVEEYKERLKLRGADPVLVDTIITPRGTRAYGASVGGNITLERVVEDFTEDHEVFHQVFQNMEKMRVFKNFDKAELISEAKDLYGDLTEPQLEEEMAKDFQQYVNEQENGKSTSFFGKIAEFFQKLFSSIKRIFQNKNDINEFYRTVYSDRATQETEINNEMPKAFEQQVKDGLVDFRIQNATANFLDEVPVKDAFTDSGDLTLKTIQKLQGRTTVSKQYIYDLTNSGDIKQVERDLIRSVLDSLPDDQKVDVAQFAQDVKDELLPLTTVDSYGRSNGLNQYGSGKFSPKYESISLPDDIRGNVSNYAEHIYESSIKTSAGNIHFSGNESENYFGHTRIEDMAGEVMSMGEGIKRGGTSVLKNPGPDGVMGTPGTLRRVIEVQSDLYQKGRINDEFPEEGVLPKGRSSAPSKEERIVIAENRKKLTQYNDPTAHFRMVREEIRKAAQDGKTKLQFPTGETAMKIEGLGDRESWSHGNDFHSGMDLLIRDLSKEIIGKEVTNLAGIHWIITDVLGDGKFKAVPKNMSFDRMVAGGDYGTVEMLGEGVYGDPRNVETFDISGKVDTSNPIYRFYEKDLGRYLKNNYNAVSVIDDKGVTWMEVPIQKAYGDLPVPAFNERKETQTVEQLQNQRERFKQSLQAFKDNPQAHIQAYGEDRSQLYKDKIDQITKRIQEIKNPKFDTGNKLDDLKKSLQSVEARTGVTPIEREKLIKKGNKYHFEIPELNRFTATDLILQGDPLQGHPAKPFLKYVNPRTGELPPIHEDTPGVYGREMTSLLEKKKMTIDQAQQEVNNYIENANLLEQLYEDRFNPIELSPETIVSTPIFESEVARLKDRNGKPLETMLNQSDPIPLKNKVGVIDYFRTPNRVLKKVGLEDEAKLLKKKYVDYLKELPKNIQRITDYAKSLPKTIDGKPVTQRIFDYLNGGNVDENGFLKPDFLTADEQKVADSIKSWLEDWADRLKIPHHQRISNYITHVFEDDLIKKEFDEDLAKIIQGKVAGQVYDPFLEKRLGALGYKRDVWSALEAYVKRATRKVHMDVALEQIKIAAKKLDIASYNYVNEYIDRVNLRPTKVDVLLDNSLKQMFGYKFGQRPVARLSKLGRQMVSRGTLGLNISSALRNLTQGINTYSRLGEKYTIIGYTKLLNRLNHQELYDEGILGNDLASQDKTLSATKKFWEKTDKALFYLFETVEHINRGSAYFGAKAKYYAENSRTEDGTQIWKEGASEEKAREYARQLVEDTQFTFGAVDTPTILSSDIVKTLAQFQSFNIKQVEFLSDMGKNKNYAGLIRFVVATLLVGYTIGKLFGFKWQDMIPFARYSIAPIPKAIGSIIGAATDAPDQFGNQRTAKQKGLDILNTATPFIPAYVQGSKTYQGIQSIKQGETSGATEDTEALAFGSKPLANSPVSKKLNASIKTAQTKLSAFDPSLVNQIQPIYDQAKAAGFGTSEADSLVSNLTDNQYAVYNAMKAVDTAKDAITLEPKILPIVQKASLLGFGTQGADDFIASSFPDTPEGDREFAVYKSIKTTLFGANAGIDNNPDSTTDSTSTWDKQSLIDHVGNMAKALGTDPVTTFNDIFAGNQSWRILGVKNGQVMVARADQSVTDAIRKKEGATKEMRLDHTISIEAGGNNSNDNLLLIPKGDENTPGTWAWNTPTENLIGKALTAGKITGAKAREYEIRFKMTAGENLSDTLKKEYKNKYNSQPITPEQIKQELGIDN